MDRKTLWFSCLFFVFLSTWVPQAQEQPARALVYSTYFGGSGDDEGGGIAVDAQGNIYVAGTTSSTDFPTIPNAHQRVLRGRRDVFVTKFDAAGSLVYSTYLGDECDDYGTAIAVDAAGNAYVTGRANFLCSPLTPRPPGAFVAKLDPTGALRYFFIFGGRFADTSTGLAITVDAEGNPYVAGWTNVSDFPTTPGAFQRTYGGGLRDGFVAKVNAAGDGLVYSTYLGGRGDEGVNGIAVDEDGNAYVTGSTDSRDFPVENAFQPNPRGGPTTKTGFVTKLSPDGSALVYSTYLGGRFTDVAAGIAVDADGNAYVTGETESDDFPTTPGVLQPDPGWRICTWYLCTDAFVTKLNAAGDALVYSTYLYGENSDGGAAIAVDADGNAYVVGETASIYFPIVNAFQPNSGLNTDAFVAKLNRTASELAYSPIWEAADPGRPPAMARMLASVLRWTRAATLL